MAWNRARSVMKQIKKKAIFLCLTLGLLGAGVWSGFLFLETGSGRTYLLDQLNGQIPGRVSMESLDLSIFQGRVDISNVQLYGPDQKEVARVQAVLLNLSWLGLLTGDLIVESLEVDSPDIHLKTTLDGSSNLLSAFVVTPQVSEPEPLDSPSVSFPLNIRVKSFLVTKGRVSYDDAPINLAFSNINIQILDFDLGEAKANLVIKTSVEDLNLGIQGQVSDLFSDPRVDLRVDAGGDPSSMGYLMPDLAQWIPRGVIDFGLTAKGAVNNPLVDLFFDSKEMDIQGISVKNFRVRAGMKDRKVGVTEFSLGSDQGQAAFTGSADLVSMFPRGFMGDQADINLLSYAVNGDVQGIDLSRLEPLETRGVKGLVNAGIEISGKGIVPGKIQSVVKTDVTLKEVWYPGLKIPVNASMKAMAKFDGDQARLQTLSLDFPGLNVIGTGVLDVASMAVDGRLSVEAQDLAQLDPFIDLGARGGFRVDARINGVVDAPIIEVTASGDDLGVQGIGLGNLTLKAGLKPDGALQVDQVRLENKDGIVTGGGRIEVFDNKASHPMDMWLTMENLSLFDLLLDTEMGGRLNGRINLTGTLGSPIVRAQVTGDDLAFEAVTIGNASVEGYLEKGRLTLDHLLLRNKDAELSAIGSALILDPDSGLIENPEIHLDIQGQGILFQDLFPHARGTMDMDAQLRGHLFDPLASLSLSGGGIGLENYELGDLTLDGQLKKGLLKLNRILVKNKQSGLDLSASIQIFDPATMEVKTDPSLTLNINEGQILLEDFMAEAAGIVSVFGRVNGKLSNLTGRLGVKTGPLKVMGQAIEAGGVEATLKGQTIEIDRAELRFNNRSLIEAQGSLNPMDQTFDLRVHSKAFNLKDLALAGQHSIDSGLVSLDLQGQGTFGAPMVDAQLKVSDLVVHGEPQPPVDLGLHLKEQVLDIQGQLSQGKGQASSGESKIIGQYSLDTQAFSTALELENMNLAPYFKLAGRPGFAGLISGQFQARGQVSQLDRINVQADVETLHVAWTDQPFLSIENARLSIDEGQIDIPPARMSLGKDGFVQVQGQGNMTGALDFSVKGELPLGMIPALAPGVESAAGKIRLTADVSGSLAEPRVFGTLDFEDLSLVLDGIEQEVRKVNGRIQMDPDQIQVVGVGGNLDDGRFDLNGRMGIKRWAPDTLDFTLKASQLEVDIPDLMEMSTNLDLTLKGTARASELKGDVVILQGRYYRDVDLSLLHAATSRTRSVAPIQEAVLPGFLDTIGLNVNLTRQEPILIDNNLAELEVSPDLTLKGKATAPLVRGRAQVDNGIIRFQNTEFEVKKGVIDFLNPYRIEPDIDVVGEAEIRNWTIIIKVQGTPDDLDLTFESTPSEQHADILSLIAFGKTTRELRASDGGGLFAPEEIFAAMVSQSLQKNIKDSTGLDYFEVKTDQDDDTGDSRVNVTMGADLSRQITVKYGVRVKKGETVHRVTTSYKLLESLLMNGYQETDGQFGGELKYRLEFR